MVSWRGYILGVLQPGTAKGKSIWRHAKQQPLSCVELHAELLVESEVDKLPMSHSPSDRMVKAVIPQ